MYKRWIKLTVLTLMLLLPLAVVSGQSLDKRAVLCGDLAEADCQILVDSDVVMDGVNAFAFDLSMTLSVEAPEPDEMSLSLDASGRLSISAEAMEAVQEMEDSLMEMDGQELSDEMVAIFDAAIAGITAELTADLQITNQDGIEDMALNLLTKDGIVMLNAAAVAEATGESMGGMEWFGVDANGVFALLTADSDMQDMMKSEDSHSDMADMSEMAMAPTVTRLADSEVNGVPVAVFESSLNMSQIMALLSPVAGDAADSAATLDATVLQFIGLDDYYQYRAEATINVAESSSMTTINVWFALGMSDFNLPVTVEIPEDAFVFPLEFLMEMGS